MSGDNVTTNNSESASASKTSAVIRFQGKQFRVTTGERLAVDRLLKEPGSNVTISEVLLSNGKSGATSIGTPLVAGASVTARVVRHFRGPKVVTFKKVTKNGYQKKQGHRQNLTEIRIESISE